MTQQKLPVPDDSAQDDEIARPVPPEAIESLVQQTGEAADAISLPSDDPDIIGWTMFDTPQAKDNVVVGLMPRDRVGKVPRHSLVRIEGRDGRRYLGAIVAGPFTEPDGLRGDAPVVVNIAVRGAGQLMIPAYHGRMHIELLGEEADGGAVPTTFRPLPNSPVRLLSPEETARVLNCGGDMALGRAIGLQDLTVAVPSDRKSVLPRHTAVLGTTGAGKSTTVARLIQQARRSGMAVVLMDVEGEYTAMHQATQEPGMLAALKARGLEAQGVPDLRVFYPVNRDTSADPQALGENLRPFTLLFSRLSPYTVVDILDMSDAQATRYWQAYETTKKVLRELGIFPSRLMGRVNSSEDRESLELDEFERGYPRMTLSHLLDIVNAFMHRVSNSSEELTFYNDAFEEKAAQVKGQVQAVRTDNERSWRALLSRLWRLQRLEVFDQPGARPLEYSELVEPGRVSIIDLSDTESPELRNLVIADVLRGVQEAQERRYREAQRDGARPPRTLVIVEEAHEFLSAERIRRMQNLFQQVARIARRGRKRWLGLVFVTQHPQHLPDELFGLVNNYILHRINDANVIARLRRSIGGIEASLWDSLTSLAPGQAVVSFTHMARPLLVAVDPAPCRLRMADE